MDHEVSPMLAPVVALILWTLIQQLWRNAKRLAAMKRKRTTLAGGVSGSPGIPDDVLEDHAEWIGHGHDHFIGQPTLFYAIAISMALLHGHGYSATNLVLAWAYVFFRIAHSLVRATLKAILYRFVLFGLASVALLGLALHAAVHAW